MRDNYWANPMILWLFETISNEDKICVIGGENNSIYICKLEYS